MAKYTVFVDDNYHYMDESERYKAGEYDTAEEAIAKCKEIVDSFFNDKELLKQDYDGLVTSYVMFGEDPFIISEDKSCKFSARDYARQKAEELAKKKKK